MREGAMRKAELRWKNWLNLIRVDSEPSKKNVADVLELRCREGAESADKISRWNCLYALHQERSLGKKMR